ncbi:hypothetical protein OKW21_006738 [Catalinimonas alkaloidigena]|nr:hypothetical protein [Catalinimonas alkaloidigena]
MIKIQGITLHIRYASGDALASGYGSRWLL